MYQSASSLGGFLPQLQEVARKTRPKTQDERVTIQNVHFKIHFAENHFAHLIASLFIDDQYENYLSTPMISEVKRRKM